MPVQPLARLNSGAAFCTPASNSVSMPGLTSICAISRIMGFPFFPLPAGERVASEASRVRAARRFNSSSERPSPHPAPLRGEGAPAPSQAALSRRLLQPALHRGDRLVGRLHVAEVRIEGRKARVLLLVRIGGADVRHHDA